MSSVVGKLGVQSYCFRHFKSNEKVAELVRACGLGAIELCGVHADFKDESSFAKVIEPYASRDIAIVSIGVQGLNGDEATLRHFCTFCQQAGAKYMAVNFSPMEMHKAIPVADKLAAEYNLKLAIHNHGGRHALGSAAMLEYIFSLCSERIGLCLDTAWALDSGEDVVGMVKRFGKRLHGLHIKDFVFDRARKPEDVVVGTGNLNLGALQAALDEVAFSGYAVLEYEGDVENPVPALTKCVAAVRQQMK